MYTTDRKGDLDNLKYGCIDKYKVPRYFTTGHGALIGLGRQFRQSSLNGVQRQINDESLDSIRGKRRTALLTSKKVESKSLPIQPLSSEDDADFIQQAGFVPLSSLDSNERMRPSEPYVDETDGQVWQYDIVATKVNADHAKDIGNHLNLVSTGIEVDAFERFRNHEDNKLQIELTKRTQTCPQDVDSWQKLIHHQEKYMRLISNIDEQKLNTSQKNAVAEMRISLYQKALSNVSRKNDKIQLTAAMMMEGSVIWDTYKQLQEWTQALRTLESFNLQIQFLNFKQHNPLVYNYEQCLQALSRLMHHTRDSEGSAEQLAYLALRVTSLMRASGYAERAIAIWQALIEVNCFTLLQGQHCAGPMVAFEKFWDSEAPRIGEMGARGWQSISSSGREPQADNPLPEMSENSISLVWGSMEEKFSNKYIMPARTLDETTEDDPYRVVLFTDIKDYIFQIDTSQNTSNQALLLAFLRFCGLPPFPFTTFDVSESWWKDAFISSCWGSHVGTGQSTSNAPSTRFLLSDMFTLTRNEQSSFTSFADGYIFNSQIYIFAILVLTQLVEFRAYGDWFAEYLIALKLRADPQAGRKFAKSLLKKYSNRPRLYNCYAMSEAYCGNTDAAHKVWSTALSMAASFEEEASVQADIILLWHDWIWELLEGKIFDQAMQMVVIDLPSGKFLKPSKEVKESSRIAEDDVLRAKQFMNTRINTALEAHQRELTIWYTNLLAILNYLVSDRNLNEALRSFDTTITVLSKVGDTRAIEYIHQSRARLIDLHTRTNPQGYRPSEILSAIRVSYDLYPENSIFYDLYDRYSRQSGLIDRLRNIELKRTQNQHSQVGNSKRADEDSIEIENIAPAVLKLTSELSRLPYAGSTQHSIRAAFRRATQPSVPSLLESREELTHEHSGSAQHSPLIWSNWLHWELSLLPQVDSSRKSSSSLSSKETPHKRQSKQIKDIYLSALRNCPWDKNLHLLAFTHPTLHDQVLNRADLEGIYRSMIDRGMRIHIEVDLDDD